MREASPAQASSAPPGCSAATSASTSLLGRLGGVLRAMHAGTRLVLAPHPAAPDRFDAFWIAGGRVRDWGAAADGSGRARAAHRRRAALGAAARARRLAAGRGDRRGADRRRLDGRARAAGARARERARRGAISRASWPPRRGRANRMEVPRTSRSRSSSGGGTCTATPSRASRSARPPRSSRETLETFERARDRAPDGEQRARPAVHRPARADGGAARRHRRAADHRGERRRLRVRAPGRDARLRPRRPHRDAARRRADARRPRASCPAASCASSSSTPRSRRRAARASSSAAGVLDGVDLIYGCHLWTPLELGKVAVQPGPFMAASDFLKLTITGRGGHAGLPHDAIDPIAIAAQVVTNLQHVVSRRTDPLRSAVRDDRLLSRRRRAERDPRGAPSWRARRARSTRRCATACRS